MDSRVSLALGLLSGALVVRERKAKRAVERFAAAALETLLNAIDANDPQTSMHVRRVAAYAGIIADAAGVDEHEHKAIERVGLFHDIGKIHEALFDIVHDVNTLTPAERRAIATHPARGAEVLAPFAAFYPELAKGVVAHHERWDGSGYPKCLRGRRIPFEARVVSIADTFDAVAHARRYKAANGVETAFRVIAAGRGTQFDPELVDLTLLPPVVSMLARVRIPDRRSCGRRRVIEHEPTPDISFRWRSDSLGLDSPIAVHDVD
jgi:putative nucleotidyltransferase with HDIG domain